MMPCRIFEALTLCFVLAASVPGHAGPVAPAAPGATNAPRCELAIVVVDSIQMNTGPNGNFDRVARVFTDVFQKIQWPLDVTVERLAANTPDHDTELRVFLQDSGYLTSEEFTFRAWITLSDHGTKHDFGMVGFTCRPRLRQGTDEVLDMAIRGVALIIARKIAPILFSEPLPPKS